jgi:uncharacterized membrane protein
MKKFSEKQGSHLLIFIILIGFLSGAAVGATMQRARVSGKVMTVEELDKEIVILTDIIIIANHRIEYLNQEIDELTETYYEMKELAAPQMHKIFCE